MKKKVFSVSVHQYTRGAKNIKMNETKINTNVSYFCKNNLNKRNMGSNGKWIQILYDNIQAGVEDLR